jgi:hypothetical protein
MQITTRIIDLKTELGYPIAYSRTAEMFAWREGKVLKLYYDWFSREDIAYEARIAQVVQANGLPVVAAARLSEQIPEVEKWLIGQVEKGL